MANFNRKQNLILIWIRKPGLQLLFDSSAQNVQETTNMKICSQNN